jgi:hypothetical protein
MRGTHAVSLRSAPTFTLSNLPTAASGRLIHHSSFKIHHKTPSAVGGLPPHLAFQASFRLGYSFPQRFFLGSLAFANDKKSV